MRTNEMPLLLGLLLCLATAPTASAFYSPSTGRWLSRDPIGESGGVALSAFQKNDLVDRVDPFGLKLPDEYIGFPPDWWTPKGLGEDCCCNSKNPTVVSLHAEDDGSSLMTFRMKLIVSRSGCTKRFGITWVTCSRPTPSGPEVCGAIPACQNQQFCSFGTYPSGFPGHAVGIYVRWLYCPNRKWEFNQTSTSLYCERRWNGDLECK
jgi:hypothetical protein